MQAFFVVDGTTASLEVEVLELEHVMKIWTWKMQEHLCKDFESERRSHFHGDVSVMLIDKTDGSNPTERETYWIPTLKTIAPYDLNDKNVV